jgi:hypothetical protein
MPYPHLTAIFAPEEEDDGDGELFAVFGVVNALAVVRWTTVEVVVVELEVEFIYSGVVVVVVVVPVDVEDAAAEVDVEDWDWLDDEVVELPVVVVVLVVEDPEEEADEPDAIEKNGEKFIWVVSESSMISIV